MTSKLAPFLRTSEFQLTRSRGAWLITIDRYALAHNFNSHAHVERDRVQPISFRLNLYFNSHAHVERDRCRYLHFTKFIPFQLTRSRGAWRFEICYNIVILIFQLTRSRGAWPPFFALQKLNFYFNSHAHVERDSLTSSFIISLWYFNSHAHVERDMLRA